MQNFANRSGKKELLDEEHIPVADLHRNLHELEVINRLLGGHNVTLDGLEKLNLDNRKTYTILDIGSGGGDTLKVIAAWGAKKGLSLDLAGVDLKKECIDYAKAFCKPHPNIRFIKTDYRKLADEPATPYDIIITSLFCHHLSNEELAALFSWAANHARIAFIMNDLHRNPLAYYSISWITRLFSRSYLVKNDARLSVLRGFKRHELTSLLNLAGIPAPSFTLTWKWAFRWLLIIKKESRHE